MKINMYSDRDLRYSLDLTPVNQKTLEYPHDEDDNNYKYETYDKTVGVQNYLVVWSDEEFTATLLSKLGEGESDGFSAVTWDVPIPSGIASDTQLMCFRDSFDDPFWCYINSSGDFSGAIANDYFYVYHYRLLRGRHFIIPLITPEDETYYTEQLTLLSNTTPVNIIWGIEQ